MELRKIRIRHVDGVKVGFFHQWINESGAGYSGVYGVVELEEGEIAVVPSFDLQFDRKPSGEINGEMEAKPEAKMWIV